MMRRRLSQCVALFVVLAVAFCVQGCTQNSAPNVAYQSFAKTGSWALMYVDGKGIRMYAKGADRFMARDPLGGNSLAVWMGYSNQLGAVLAYPGLERHFSVIRVNTKVGVATKSDFGHVVPGECDGQTASVSNGRLFTIRGKGSRAELWQCDTRGRWVRAAAWELPRSIPVRATWETAPAVDRGRAVFETHSGHLVLASIKTGATPVVLRQGARTLSSDDQRGPWTERDSPTFSSDGRRLAYGSRVGEFRSPKLHVIYLRTHRSKQFTIPVNHSITPPASLFFVKWIPGTDLVACEVEPAGSGYSDMCVVDSKTGRSGYLPFMVSRRQWCIIPGPQGS